MEIYTHCSSFGHDNGVTLP